MRDILIKMKEFNIKFTISDDSHGPNDVGMHYSRLKRYLEQVEIDEIWYPVKTMDSKLELKVLKVKEFNNVLNKLE